MRALWKGTISFGPITVPAKLYPATESREPKYHYLHKSCSTPLEYARNCPRCKLEVSREQVVRGYEHGGDLVVLTEKELKALIPKGKHMLQLVQCADAEAVDPLYFDKAYYLEPEAGGEKAYVLLREALARSNQVALGSIVLREKEHPVLLRPYQDILLLHTLFYPSEVADWKRFSPALALPQERDLKAARGLVEKLSGGFDPQRFTNRFYQALLDLLEQKEREKKAPIKHPRKQRAAPPPSQEAA